MRKTVWESKMFSIQRMIGGFYKYFYIQQIEKLAYHSSYYKIIGNIMLLKLDIKNLNPHQATPVLGQIMPKYLDFNPAVNYRMNYSTKFVPYTWKVAV